MARTDWKDTVTIDSEVHHGDPCIKGTRIPVSIVVGRAGPRPAAVGFGAVPGRTASLHGAVRSRSDRPEPHRGVIGVDLLQRILRRAAISREGWLGE